MLPYAAYFDKLYGCFLGKTVAGTMGAPFEGIKMPLEMPFRREMIDTMLPNDDLDLQVLWLDTVAKYGEDFTSYDLLESFARHCDYSPGEYAVMRKNYERGIYPPLSGQFCNDFYRHGMGCPIRSEIWACLAPLQPKRAAAFASRDGVLDHGEESVFAERFLAAMESAAFEESNLDRLIEVGLSVVPPSCQFRRVVTDTVSWCRQYRDVKLVLRKILFYYGHPDCTNLFQNIGITLAALYLGNLDLIQTAMSALNCGFDTDCTCATAGAIIGLIRGADDLINTYDLGEVRFVLGVRSENRPKEDSVFHLAEDIAKLGVTLNPTQIEHAPAVNLDFEDRSQIPAFSVLYENDDPTITIGGSRRVTLLIQNKGDAPLHANLCVNGLFLNQSFSVSLAGHKQTKRELLFSVPPETALLYETNLISVDFSTAAGAVGTWKFGIVGCTLWKAIGPIWRTDPICTTQALQQVSGYWELMNIPYTGDPTDIVRRFHLNFAPDTDTAYLRESEAFAPLKEDNTASLYEERLFSQKEDSFTMDRLCGMKGPVVMYLARALWSDQDCTVCLQIGHSAPFTLYINGKEIAARRECDTWDAENVHVQNVFLHKGINRILMRLTRVNADAKWNLTFSAGATCAAHLVQFASVNPYMFGKQ